MSNLPIPPFQGGWAKTPNFHGISCVPIYSLWPHCCFDVCNKPTLLEGDIIKINKIKQPVTEQQSLLNEIVKYKDLLDEGIITEQEFTIKEDELLRKMK